MTTLTFIGEAAEVLFVHSALDSQAAVFQAQGHLRYQRHRAASLTVK
jgi:hypothetical protein